MCDEDLRSMSLAELWIRYEAIEALLVRQIEAKKRQLEQRLEELARTLKPNVRRASSKLIRQLQNRSDQHDTTPAMESDRLAIEFEAGGHIDDLRMKKTA
jgi:hypothetical protein